MTKGNDATIIITIVTHGITDAKLIGTNGQQAMVALICLQHHLVRKWLAGALADHLQSEYFSNISCQHRGYVLCFVRALEILCKKMTFCVPYWGSFKTNLKLTQNAI